MKFFPSSKSNSQPTLGSRGQAAMVDSMFFIAIVSAVCTGLFYFAINYGLTTQDTLNSFYSSDFAMDSLKVITYINVYRNGEAVTTDAEFAPEKPQYDYLLALIKEDYAKNKVITIQTKTAIANTLHSVLKPYDSSVDYVFFISKEGYRPSENKYITMIISTRKCISGCEFDSSYLDRNIERAYYSCEPPVANSGVLEKYIFPYAGRVDSAIGKISLIDRLTDDSSNELYSYYISGLYLWVAKDINKLNQIVATSEDPDLSKHEADFNCMRLNTI